MAGETWRLGHRPALDGLRGIAVLLVVVAHMALPVLVDLDLGRVGVLVFFTLSGFLITALLLSEFGDTGTVSMRRFYARRAHRLAPALLVVLAAVFSVEWLVYGKVPYWWAVMLNIGNWVPVFQNDGSLLLLTHTWSLAIEEQFYLVWPLALVVMVRLGSRRAVIALTTAGIVASLWVGFALAATDGSGYRTDVNAYALLAGCLVACLFSGCAVPRAPRVVLWLGVGLGVVATATGWPLIPFAVALLIWSAVTTGVRWLEVRPLVWAGRLSYGWYLWNYPIAMFVERVGVSAWWAPVISLGCAVASRRYVEEPFLRRRQGSSVAVMMVGQKLVEPAGASSSV